MIENENENAKTAKLVTQRKCQHTIWRLRVLRPYGVEFVTNGGRYLGRSSTRLRQQVWLLAKLKLKLKLKINQNENHTVPKSLPQFCRWSSRGFSPTVAIATEVNNKSVVFTGWRCQISYANVGNISPWRGQTVTGRHINYTHTMRWEIYYVHPQSGRVLLLDMLRQPSSGSRAVCSGKNLPTNTDRQIYRDRITENNGTYTCTGWAQKLAQFFVRINFIKYQPIFKIILLSESGRKFVIILIIY